MAKSKGKFILLDVTKPFSSGVCTVLLDRWWWCDNGDITKAVFYEDGKRRYPQCNTCKLVMRDIERCIETIPNVQIVKIPLAFAPHYCD